MRKYYLVEIFDEDVVRYFNSQQVLRLFLTCEGIQEVNKDKNLVIT